jgi:hypothetical protein
MRDRYCFLDVIEYLVVSLLCLALVSSVPPVASKVLENHRHRATEMISEKV